MKNILLLNLFIISVFAVSAKDFIITYEFVDSSRKLVLNAWVGEGNTNYSWETIPNNQSGSGTIPKGNKSFTFNDIPTGKKIRLKFEPQNLFALEFSKLISRIENYSTFIVEQWGEAEWKSTRRMFNYISVIEIIANDTPNFSKNQSMNGMFAQCNNLSKIKNIHTWNTLRVKDMAMVFFYCHNFNQSINSWKTDSVTTFEKMFQNANRFNQNLDSWNTSQVTNFEKMFEGAHKFNGKIGTWNTENAVTFEEMFSHAFEFNQPIGDWNTGNILTTRRMFWKAHKFNQPIGDWNTEKIVNMEWMFNNANKFNQPVGKWNTSNVTNMWDMFIFNYNFNQDISNWNVENVIDIRGMFFEAWHFNQNLGKWKFHPSARMERIITSSGFNCFNYTSTIIGWAQNNPFVKDKIQEVNNYKFGNNAIEARNQLINQGWIFYGDIGLETDCGITSVNSVFALTIKIYPNPTKESITIEGLVHNTKIAVVNLLGENVATIQAHSGINTFSLFPLINGVYFLRFEQNGQLITRKVILQN